MDMNLSKLQEMVKDREACHAAAHGVGHNWVSEQQQWNIVVKTGRKSLQLLVKPR